MTPGLQRHLLNRLLRIHATVCLALALASTLVRWRTSPCLWRTPSK
jgi:hypothetical protein